MQKTKRSDGLGLSEIDRIKFPKYVPGLWHGMEGIRVEIKGTRGVIVAVYDDSVEVELDDVVDVFFEGPDAED